jgi:type IV pilus assembly protein PilP
MRRTATMGAGGWLLACVLVGAGAFSPPAAAESRGPVAALDKARGVAHQAAQRAGRMNAAVRQERRSASKDARPARYPAPHPQRAAAPSRSDVATSTNLTPGAPSESSAQLHTEATEAYDPAQHRDPFQPPRLATVSDEEGPRTPLERYELGQLKLVGVVWGEDPVRAMVEDSAGLGYIVVRGTPIGSSGGFVRAIEPDRVLIEETNTNFYGEPEPREVVMELSKEDGSP